MEEKTSISLNRAHTYLDKESFSFSWEIHNFNINERSLYLSKPLQSQYFRDPYNKCTWYLTLSYQKQNNQIPNIYSSIRHFVNLNLCLGSDHNENFLDKYFYYKSFVNGIETNANKLKSYCMIRNCKEQGICVIPNIDVTRYCNFSETDSLAFQIDLFVSQIINHSSKAMTDQLHDSNISKDFEHIFNNKELADFTFLIGKDKIYAHKAILAARSPVFLAMFKNNTDEKLKNEVKIIDFDLEIVDEMLYFLYTGKTRYTKKLANGLLSIADKYQIQELKEICEQSLFDQMNIKNVIEILVSADRHNCLELKKKACNFIAVHNEKVFESAEYNEFKNLYPQLLVDVLMNTFDFKKL